MSDYGGIGNSHTVQHIGENLAETGMMALEAGMDIEMPSPAGYGQGLYEAFRTGRFFHRNIGQRSSAYSHRKVSHGVV